MLPASSTTISGTKSIGEAANLRANIGAAVRANRDMLVHGTDPGHRQSLAEMNMT